MINEVISKKERQEEQKMMSAIHQNYRDARMNRKIDEQLKVIEEQEKDRYYSRWCKIIFITCVVGLILEIVGPIFGL